MIEGPIQTNNSGLVFYFDTKEPKSYVGEPTTNLEANPIDFSLWTSGATTTVTANAGYAPNGTLKATRVVTTGFWGSIISSPSNSTTYTWSIYLRSNTGANQTIQCFFEDNGNYGATFVAVNFTVTPQWERFFITATSATSTSIPRFSIRNGDLLAWGIQLEQKSRMSAFTTTSRSNTQGLLDLTGGSTIDLTNAGYNASSEISFNGSSNYITIDKTATQLGLISGGQMTVEVFVRLSSLSGYTHIVDGSGNRWHLAVENSGDGASAYFWNGSSYHSTSSPAITANTWVYIAGVQESSLLKIYINGVLATNGSLSSAASNLLQDCNVAIGYWQGNNSRYLNGQIGYVRIYNRALSASEILKNFNSQRSRYSV